MKNKKVIYCSYDGLSDPLGGSQVLPYLFIFKNFITELKIISFEKKKNFLKINNIKNKLQEHNIHWKYFAFSKKFFFLGKFFDSLKIFFYLLFNKFDIIHSRGYFPIVFIIFIKKIKKFDLIFDMRGLWFDEKKDSGSLNMDNFFHRILYFILMKIEKKLLINSDVIVVLTKKAKLEIINKYRLKDKVIYIIPCCADYNLFKPLEKNEKQIQKKLNNIPSNSNVICYLGSIGTWYMIDEMILFFEKIITINNNFYFLIISNDINNKLIKLINLKNKKLNNKIILKNSEREDIPKVLGCADIMISFIKPFYSKIASSPTKYAESLAMGIPVISNKGIGDIDELTKYLEAGKIIDLNLINNFNENDLNNVLNINSLELRNRSKSSLSLDFALEQYKCVYKEIM